MEVTTTVQLNYSSRAQPELITEHAPVLCWHDEKRESKCQVRSARCKAAVRQTGGKARLV